MIRIFIILISGQRFDLCRGCGTTLKLVVNIYPLNRPTKYGGLVIRFVPIDT